nr:unnamed protein product [Callosobruchus analis]
MCPMCGFCRIWYDPSDISHQDFVDRIVCEAIEGLSMSLVVSEPPTLYEHYTAGGIHTGLNTDKPYFTLNDRNISIYMETYIPWNLHEPQPESFDFGQGGSDWEHFLDVKEFLTIAKEEDLFAIVRPGPFICSEWEFGGLPSWLLREAANNTEGIKFRTSDGAFMKYVSRYFSVLIPILAMLQFTKGGPIIAFQVENEYASTYEPGVFTPDKEYLRQLRQIMIDHGIVEQLMTSDAAGYGTIGSLPGLVLQTANFASNPEHEFNQLKTFQPNRPIMAMEYWTGWFDHWSENHHQRSGSDFQDNLERILRYPASVNMYMFIGGTSFGFMNGANLNNVLDDNSGYQPDTTSYDYDAPLAENGDYSIKYVIVKELLKKHNPVQTRLPKTPHLVPRVAYKSQQIRGQLTLDEIIQRIPNRVYTNHLIPMELLPVNNMSGQSYGYVIYRHKLFNLQSFSQLTIDGRIRDSIVVTLNDHLISKPLDVVEDLNGFGFWRTADSTLDLGPTTYTYAAMDLMVENWGRVGFGKLSQFYQFKGLWSTDVYVNREKLQQWEIFPLEFKKSWISSLTGWHAPSKAAGPSLYKTEIFIEDPTDTYLDMQSWCKGIVIVNNFVLGRYSVIGPQQTLYLPGPFLRKGWNEILVFEHYRAADRISFTDQPVFKTRTTKERRFRNCRFRATPSTIYANMASLPTLYDYYTQGGITSGLSADQPYFTLNNRNISIYSGAVHYFRVPSKYDFGDGGTDFQDFLDVQKFIKIAQEEDLFVLIRPGPYICAEWEFGGLPSWLLREEGIKVRTSDEKYLRHVRRYFNILLGILAAFQFTKGGPIIGFQVENEYGSTSSKNPPFSPDTKYVEEIRGLMLKNNITQLLFTSDSPLMYGNSGTLPTLLQTANFDKDPERNFDALKKLQKDKPSMAMEYWSGWFMHWTETPYQGTVEGFRDLYERILKYPASVNLYMFHGGTTWGFLNGANMDSAVQATYKPDITGYDYDAPLTENGDYTKKYEVVKELLEKYNPIKTKLPVMPSEIQRTSYPEAKIKQFIGYESILSQLPHKIESQRPISMENLPINNGSGQSYGYIIYRKKNVIVHAKSILKISGYVHDTIQVYVNGKLLNKNVVDTNDFGFWKIKDSSIIIKEPIDDATLDLVVCNMGRNNFGHLDTFHQFKGIWKSIYLNDQEMLNWEIYPIEFKKTWTEKLEQWLEFGETASSGFGLGLYKAEFELKETHDTFVDMSKWQKGVVIVNNFVLGRYWKVGPQQTLYLPAPLLKAGKNQIVVFEEFRPEGKITFSSEPLKFNNFTNIV